MLDSDLKSCTELCMATASKSTSTTSTTHRGNGLNPAKRSIGKPQANSRRQSLSHAFWPMDAALLENVATTYHEFIPGAPLICDFHGLFVFFQL